jgi:hypothetical protein
LKLEWERGGEAKLSSLDSGERVQLLSTVAAAPGTPLMGIAKSGERLRIKVRTCKKVSSEGLCFQIEGRLLDLTRTQREALFARLTESA